MIPLASVALIVAFGLWSRRVPLQNLGVAATVIAALTFCLSLVVSGPPQRLATLPWTTLVTALAAIPGSRLLAEVACRRWRSHANYGVVLTTIAALLAAVPIGLTLRPIRWPPTHSAWGALGFGSLIIGWSAATYLITLPFWLDKRHPVCHAPTGSKSI